MAYKKKDREHWVATFRWRGEKQTYLFKGPNAEIEAKEFERHQRLQIEELGMGYEGFKALDEASKAFAEEQGVAYPAKTMPDLVVKERKPYPKVRAKRGTGARYLKKLLPEGS